MIFRRINALVLILIFLAGCSSPPLANVPTDLPAPLPSETPLPTETSVPTLPAAEIPVPAEMPLLTETAIPTQEPPSTPGIILFIGDGMGAAQRQAATWLVKGKDGALAMDSLPVHGWAQTVNLKGTTTEFGRGRYLNRNRTIDL